MIVSPKINEASGSLKVNHSRTVYIHLKTKNTSVLLKYLNKFKNFVKSDKVKKCFDKNYDKTISKIFYI